MRGSTPRDGDAILVVSGDAVAGTIGGGRLEWDAIETARHMIVEGGDAKRLSVALGPDIGQCCGGHMTLEFQRGCETDVIELTHRQARETSERQTVLIYGAGHVGRALAAALSALPFRILLIDSRADELALFTAGKVETVLTNQSLLCVETAPAGAAHVVMTHSHAEDSLIAASVLDRGDFSYLGIIGSATKRALFLKAFRETGVSEDRIARIVCPIGGNAVKDKRPEVIATLAAAEITVALLA